MTLKLTLRAKLLYLTVFLLASFSLSLSVYLKIHFAKVLSEELLKRGTSIIRHAAEVCTEPLIEHDYLQLEALAQKHRAVEKDIAYMLVLNPNGDVVAHSFSDGYPLGLKMVKHSIAETGFSIRQIDYGGIPLYDLAAPVLDARIGMVRIGISAQPVHQAVDSLIGQIHGTILVLGLLALIIALPALQTIIQPVSALTRAVDRLAQRKWEGDLPVTSNDELGALTNSFNHMATTLKSAEKQLAEHAHFLQVLIDDIPLPVFYKNRKSVMLGCNYAYLDFWGKLKQDILGSHTDEIYSLEDARLHLQKDRELLEHKTPSSYEHSVIDSKGQIRHIIFNKALFYDEKGHPTGIIGVMQDITEQRRSDQMRNEFVSTVAHEFQTPLATILGFAELLQEDILDAKDREESLALIVKKAESLSEMVDELLDLARIERGKGMMVHLEPCNVGEVLHELVGNFQKRTASHHFLLELDDEKIVIPADKIRMGQVMENLLSNAVKYSKRNSTIKIAVANVGSHCQVRVSDQGIGMTEKQVAQVFEKYYRVDNSNTAPPGTGLGLFITKSIVDAHNGQISVFSEPDKGTTVTFRIPFMAA